MRAFKLILKSHENIPKDMRGKINGFCRRTLLNVIS